MENNMYKEFAGIYDNLMDDMDYESCSRFLIKNFNKDTGKILEAACGTGSVTKFLAEKNYNVTAFDLSEEMLVEAYKKLRKYPNVKILNQDMTKFSIDDKFDAALCCCDGVNYLDEEKVRLFFERVSRHLKEGAPFIFDIGTEYKYYSMYNNSTYLYDCDNIFYAWENVLDEKSQTVDININFFIKDDNDKYSRVIEEQTHYIHKTEKIIKLLEEAGFDDIKVFDHYRDMPYNDETIMAVFACQKKKK